MATAKSISLRWCQRYRLYFALSAVFLTIQLILALSFYKIHDDVESETLYHGRRSPRRGPVLVNRKDIHSASKLSEDYVIDDEDSPSNLFDKGFKENNHPVLPKNVNIALPASKDLQGLKVSQDSTGVNGTRKGDRNDEVLNLDELDFKPLCNITGKDAISAIHRATTQACKHELANITCLIQEGTLYPERLPRYCPLEGDKAYSHVGCFRDQSKKRLLPNYMKKLKNNSPSRCVDVCMLYGYHFAGVEYGIECFCGKSKPPNELKVDNRKCDMLCPDSVTETCGGYYFLSVYNTGLPKIVKQEPKPAVKRTDNSEHVRVAFLLTVNGRAVRQVYRLIKALFHEQHYFYIHVDSRQDYLFRELKTLEDKFDNIRLSSSRLSTIWGGASLLQMLLSCISELLKMREWKWDYVINLSESDFPIKSVGHLEAFLLANKGKNFVKSHGQDAQRFIAKQGLDKTFYECDTHMWRLGDRTFPWGIRVDGGSDWVALHRDLCSYVIEQNNTLLQGLMTVFRYTLLPAESFFHTVLQNSEFCETVINNNLHVANWKRKQGCKCQYKHIVDWCGCSPNDFKPEDWPRLQATEDRPYFFARKFEPIINQQIIEQVESWVHGPRKDSTNLDSYWQNDYHWKDVSPPADDAKVSIYESFARLGMKQLHGARKSCRVKLHSVLESAVYSVNDIFKGILVLYEATIPAIRKPVIVETQVRPIQHYTVYKVLGPTGRLKLLQVGSDFDVKEQVFRNFGRILGPFSEPGALHKWGAGPQFSATFVWVDPTNTVAGSYEVKVDTGSQVLYHKPTFRQPLRPGIWMLKLLYNWVLVAETLFLVNPLAVYNGQRVSSEQVKFLHSGPGQAYIDHDFTNVETVLGYSNKSIHLRQALSNSRRYGRDLQEWTDNLVSTFWSVQDTCFVAQPQHPTGGVLCPQLDLDPCHVTLWSSRAHDPKSDISSLSAPHGKSKSS